MSPRSSTSVCPSASRRSRTACASANETLQPRNRAENVAIGPSLVRSAAVDPAAAHRSPNTPRGTPVSLTQRYPGKRHAVVAASCRFASRLPTRQPQPADACPSARARGRPPPSRRARAARRAPSPRGRLLAARYPDVIATPCGPAGEERLDRPRSSMFATTRSTTGARRRGRRRPRPRPRRRSGGGLARHLDCDRIDVDRGHGREAEPRGGDRDHPRPAAGVEDAPARLPGEELDARACRRMRARAERPARIDDDGGLAGGGDSHGGPIQRPAGAHRAMELAPAVLPARLDRRRDDVAELARAAAPPPRHRCTRRARSPGRAPPPRTPPARARAAARGRSRPRRPGRGTRRGGDARYRSALLSRWKKPSSSSAGEYVSGAGAAVEVLEQPALLLGHARRHGDVEPHVEVARAGAMERRHPASRQDADHARLRAGGDLELDLAAERRHRPVVPSAASVIVSRTAVCRSSPVADERADRAHANDHVRRARAPPDSPA